MPGRPQETRPTIDLSILDTFVPYRLPTMEGGHYDVLLKRLPETTSLIVTRTDIVPSDKFESYPVVQVFFDQSTDGDTFHPSVLTAYYYDTATGREITTDYRPDTDDPSVGVRNTVLIGSRGNITTQAESNDWLDSHGFPSVLFPQRIDLIGTAQMYFTKHHPDDTSFIVSPQQIEEFPVLPQPQNNIDILDCFGVEPSRIGRLEAMRLNRLIDRLNQDQRSVLADALRPSHDL